MSQENVDAFRRATDAMNRGDVDIPKLVHPEAVFEPLRSGTEGAFIGHEGMRRFLADTEDMFEIFQASYTEVRDLGERVLAIGSIRMRARGSGVETDVRRRRSSSTATGCCGATRTTARPGRRSRPPVCASSGAGS